MLEQKEYIKHIYRCGMLSKKNSNYLECSPDSMALLNLTWLSDHGVNLGKVGHVETHGKQYCV